MMPWFLISNILILLQFKTKQCYHDLRFEKDSRYYVIRLSKDLLDDWVITLINGRIKSKLGQCRTLAFSGFNESFEHLCTLAKLRHQRGYVLKTIVYDNHLTLHILLFMAQNKEKSKILADTTTRIKNLNQSEFKKAKKTPDLNNIPSHITAQQLGFLF